MSLAHPERIVTPRTTKPLPWYRTKSSFQRGISAMHGPHQVAQKSTRATFPSRAFELKRVPSMDSKLNAGAGCKGETRSQQTNSESTGPERCNRGNQRSQPSLLDNSQDVNLLLSTAMPEAKAKAIEAHVPSVSGGTHDFRQGQYAETGRIF